jgi:hypothetical protein
MYEAVYSTVWNTYGAVGQGAYWAGAIGKV